MKHFKVLSVTKSIHFTTLRTSQIAVSFFIKGEELHRCLWLGDYCGEITLTFGLLGTTPACFSGRNNADRYRQNVSSKVG